ncbi:MFS transporter [Glaciecola sp. 2405UD65-10]|uniref:MFS transporter n=1 Tax=Glaciecola sp. 2405UD65-10 TaxID=3397244 RepID=UPI003B5A96E8
MNQVSERPELLEKVGYGLGDFASSMFWKIFSVYLMVFYTDIFGISAAAVGTMFLVSRFWDAANDPIVGIVADRLNTRWGKFRPFLAFGAIPFAIIGVLTFYTPDWSADAKLIYAYVTYTLMMMAYTVVNVPYASLLGVISSNSDDRTALASFRMVFAFAGSIFAFILIEPLINMFSSMFTTDTNPQLGWTLTMVVFGTIAAMLFFATFKLTRERVRPSIYQQNDTKEDLRNLIKNKPWFILLGAALSTLIFNSMRDGAAIYYFKYTFSIDTIELLGFSVGITTAYLVIGQAANIIGVMLATPLAKFVGKKIVFLIAMLMAAFFSVFFYYLDESQFMLILGLQVIVSMCAGIIFPLLWSMYADIADYSEYQTGRRSTGLIFSSSSFSQKMGWTLGGAMTGWTLAYFGYEANADQSEATKEGLKLMVSYIPAIGALISGIVIAFYSLTDNVMNHVQDKLKEKQA